MDLSRRADSHTPVQTRVLSRGLDASRAKGQDNMRVLSGYASVTDTEYTVYDWGGEFTELIEPGAFERSLADDPDVILNVNHAGLPLAGTQNGSLQLKEDKTGLRFDADVDMRESDVADVWRKVRRGVLRETSFRFKIVRAVWNPSFTFQTIKEVDLDRGDVTVASFGANPSGFVENRACELVAPGGAYGLNKGGASGSVGRSDFDGVRIRLAAEMMRGVSLI